MMGWRTWLAIIVLWIVTAFPTVALGNHIFGPLPDLVCVIIGWAWMQTWIVVGMWWDE